MLTKKPLFAVLFLLILVAGAVHAGGDTLNGDPVRGQDLARDCSDCHGADGKGEDESPAIAGLDVVFHVEQLQAFKTGTRKDEDEMMLMYTEDLSDQDMADLAAFYATLPAE